VNAVSVSDEKLPISETYKVVEFVTIFKTPKWWEAVVAYESSGKRSIGFYLWVKRNDVWKRKNKFSFRNLDEWGYLKTAADQLASKLSPK